MVRTITVTRGNQITLTKAEREKANIEEGDKVIINVLKDMIIVSKKNPSVFDKFESFLPANFNSVLKKIRTNPKERLKRLGVA